MDPEQQMETKPWTDNVERLSGRTTPRAAPSPREIEIDALEKAGSLLRFAAEKKEIPKNVIQSMCSAWLAREKGEWSVVVAQDFWKSFNQLCSMIKPANLESLAVANEQLFYRPLWKFWGPKDKVSSVPKRSAQRYLFLMLCLLVISIILQFVVSTATSLRSEIEGLLSTSEPIVRSASEKVPLLQAANVMDFSDPKIPDAIKPLIEAVRQQMSDVYGTFDKVTFKIEAFSRLTYFNLGEDPLHRNAIFIDPNLIELQKGINAYFRLRQRTVLRLENGGLVIGIISTSILPILLGAVGACAYVTRLIAQQVRDATYTRTTPVQHIVRVALGALAGVVIGYGGIAKGLSLPPATLAFVAGYAVEPVFAALDKMAEKIRRAT